LHLGVLEVLAPVLLGVKLTTEDEGRTVDRDIQIDARKENEGWYFREYRIGSW
jgi:hypothetical protein